MCSAYTITLPAGTFLKRRSTSFFIFAPQGSGYATPEDEQSPFPDTYEPMMEYPGTMRPGRTPEDQPFHDLPIGDNDPDPVPWPHFQQIEWHHRWDPPHEHALPMEEFIELYGKWATPEMEAAMRAGARRDVRERREQSEAEKQSTVVIDDEDDDFEMDLPVELGDGIYGQLGSIAEDAVTAAAVAPPSETEDAVEVEEETDDFDDFLLDLGLDAEVEDDVPPEKPKTATKDYGSKGLEDAMKLLMEDSEDDDDDDDTGVNLDLDLGLLDDDDFGEEEEGPDVVGLVLADDDDDITAIVDLEEDDDDGVDFDEDEDDLEDDDVSLVPLDDFSDGDSDPTEGENPFDDGGFDFGDDGDLDMDGGDMW
jgi:hypothetical protein